MPGIRPTKKQKELLDFIDQFIKEHGYSPSYREIMLSLDYTSVATVALHVNSLISRGHLRKRERAARSLEVVDSPKDAEKPAVAGITAKEEKWLIDKIHAAFKAAEEATELVPAKLDELYVLVGALRVLGLEGAAQSFLPRLSTLKKRYTN